MCARVLGTRDSVDDKDMAGLSWSCFRAGVACESSMFRACYTRETAFAQDKPSG